MLIDSSTAITRFDELFQINELEITIVIALGEGCNGTHKFAVNLFYGKVKHLGREFTAL